MNVLVLTGCDRKMDEIGALTARNHSAYAKRHGYSFERFTDYPEGRHPSWHKLFLLRERLQKFDAVAWLDADAIVTNPAKRVEDILGDHDGLVVSRDWNGSQEAHSFSMGNFIMRSGEKSSLLIQEALKMDKFKNSGLWEQSAMQAIFGKNIPGVREAIKILPRRELNAVPGDIDLFMPPKEPWEPGDFLCHLTWIPIEKRAELFWKYDLAGIEALMPFLPDWWTQDMAIDKRHILFYSELLWKAGITDALEIGVWDGATTSAAVKKIRDGVLNYTCCDVQFRENFRKVIEPVKGYVTLKQQRSHRVLAEADPFQYELIFVDGCHNLPCVREEARLLSRLNPKIILAHDSNSTVANIEGCKGAHYLLAELRSQGYFCQSDAVDRPGERTMRGLLAATKDPELAMIIKECFELTCY